MNKEQYRSAILKICIWISFLILVSNNIFAKKTYVPKYTSMIAIAQGNDTIFESNEKAELVASEKSGLFRIAVVHEVLTVKRIKSIKANELAAGLSALASVLYSMSSISKDRIQQIRGQAGAFASEQLAEIYAYNADQSKVLGMDIVFENTSGKELMVSDTERGLVWFVQPHSTLTIPASNPDIVQLRVSDLKHDNVYFVQAGGGSILKDANIEWEDDYYWAFPFYFNDGERIRVDGYYLISKTSGEQTKVTKDELKEIKKNSKQDEP